MLLNIPDEPSSVGTFANVAVTIAPETVATSWPLVAQYTPLGASPAAITAWPVMRLFGLPMQPYVPAAGGCGYRK